MNRGSRRILCFLLTLALLLQSGLMLPGAIAGDAPTEAAPDTAVHTQETEATEPIDLTEPTEATEPQPPQPDPLEGYVFPDNWAADALRFAVANGIIRGRGNKNLDPTGKTTRAEMATMLVRLVGARGSVDLSNYNDMAPESWYYEAIGAAVELGILNGMSPQIMAPNRQITRQETFTVLARAFGLFPMDENTYAMYTDAEDISNYARDAVSALTELGCLQGYGNGQVRPRQTITRQEVAALFYKLLDVICDEPEQIPDRGFVLYRGQEPLPAGLHLEGTLVLAAGLQGEIQLKDFTATDSLILRLANDAAIELDQVTAGTLAVASCKAVSGEGSIDRMIWGKAEGATGLSARELVVCAGAAFGGNYEKVWVRAGGAEFAGTLGQVLVKNAKDLTINGSAEEIVAEEDVSTITINGEVNTVLLEADNTSLKGSGYAQTVTVRGRFCTVELAHGELRDEVDWGLVGVEALVSGTTELSLAAPMVTLTATFTGLKLGNGTVDGGRPVTLSWYENDTEISSGEFFLMEGATATLTRDFSKGFGEKNTRYTVKLTCNKDVIEASHVVTVKDYDWDYDNALETVETVLIPGLTNKDTTLYKDKECKTPIRSVPKWIELTHLYYSTAEGDPGKVRMSDGTEGWIPWSDYIVSRDDFTQKEDYSLGQKEGFVNKMGYSSPHSYLVWLSLKTQRVNVFVGSQGNWKLVKTFPCATGANVSPTVAGVHSIIYKTNRWEFDATVDGVYRTDYFYVHTITGFWGGQAFHSQLYRCSDDEMYDDTMSTPVSHGCVRMLPDGCEYINNLPYHTTVVVH